MKRREKRGTREHMIRFPVESTQPQRMDDRCVGSRVAAGQEIEQLRSSVSRVMTDMAGFRELLKLLFSGADQAFDEMAAGTDQICRGSFVSRLQDLGYQGNANVVFGVICNHDDLITRDLFRQHMSTFQPCTRAPPFAEVVELAARAAGLSARDAATAAVVAEQVAEHAMVQDASRPLASRNAAQSLQWQNGSRSSHSRRRASSPSVSVLVGSPRKRRSTTLNSVTTYDRDLPI